MQLKDLFERRKVELSRRQTEARETIQQEWTMVSIKIHCAFKNQLNSTQYSEVSQIAHLHDSKVFCGI